MMTTKQLSFDAPANPRVLEENDRYRVAEYPYDQTRVSPRNPRYDYRFTPDSLDGLVGELRTVGQAHDAIAELGHDGVPEILAGARRREVCHILGRPLRVRVYLKLSAAQAIRIAHREDKGSLAVSLWDRSSSWQRMLDDGSVPSEARLADMLAEDKSTINRGLALQKAPVELLDLVADRRAITQSQWAKLAPLLEDEATRARVMERLGLLAGQRLSVPALTRQLTAAAADKAEIRAAEVKNRHGKVIATITPDHRGSFTVRVKSMAEAHPSYRLEWLKLIDKALVEAVRGWFPKED